MRILKFTCHGIAFFNRNSDPMQDNSSYARVLIIERQFIIRFDMKAQLEKAGHNIVFSQNPLEISALIESGTLDAVIAEAEFIHGLDVEHLLKRKLAHHGLSSAQNTLSGDILLLNKWLAPLAVFHKPLVMEQLVLCLDQHFFSRRSKFKI